MKKTRKAKKVRKAKGVVYRPTKVRSDDGTVFTLGKTRMVEKFTKKQAEKTKLDFRMYKTPVEGYSADRHQVKAGFDFFPYTVPVRFNRGYWCTYAVSVTDNFVQIGCKLFAGEDARKLKRWAK